METENKLLSKLNIIFLVFIILLLVLCTRLVYLQIHQARRLFEQGQRNFLRINKITPTRGNIVDKNGILIATNKPVHNLYLETKNKKSLSEQDIEDLKIIEHIIEKILTDEESLKEINKAIKHNQKLLLKSEISFDQLSKIEEHFGKNSLIFIETSFKRFYPKQSQACHILGFLGRIDLENMGKMGLEKIQEECLKGKSGKIEVKINSVGTKLSETILEKSLAGEDIKTNIDIEIQDILEQAFPQDSNGSFILMDPQDGAIVALLSRPNFDPNIFLDPISKTDWESLQENNPFLNRAFVSAYPPGSPFKLVTMSLALEKKIIAQDETCFCCGYMEFAGVKRYCHNHNGHGLLTAEQALEQSCNILFYKIAKKIDIDLLANYANRFGLGQKTNVIFPECCGIVPSKAWKKKTKGERWYKGETLSTVIGQSFLSVTPMQMARMISSIFTGYLVNPRILETEPIVKQKLEISESTLKFLRQSMRKVVTQGTGRSINRKKDFEIYAKTGTAQTSDLKKRDLGQLYWEHKWFVGCFKYKENKPLIFVIMVEHAQSPSLTKDAINKLLTEYKKLIDKREQEAKILDTIDMKI